MTEREQKLFNDLQNLRAKVGIKCELRPCVTDDFKTLLYDTFWDFQDFAEKVSELQVLKLEWSKQLHNLAMYDNGETMWDVIDNRSKLRVEAGYYDS